MCALLDEGRTGVWNRVRKRILERDHHTCQHCGAVATDVDHLVPRVMGGDDSWGNLQALCKRCHKRKSAQDHQRIRAMLTGAVGGGAVPALRPADVVAAQGSVAGPVLKRGAETGRPSHPYTSPQQGGEGLASPFQDLPAARGIPHPSTKE